MIIVIVVIALLVILALIVFATYNGLVNARNMCDEAWSTIDVQLKRRHDLIPNLVETVKGYATHETEAFESVSKARAAAIAARTPQEAAATEGFLTQALGQLFAIAEAYPQLRAVESFTQLQLELSNTEDQISAARRIYNGNVQTYLTKCQQFPGVLLAGPFGFSPRAFFELDNQAEREPIKVDFGASAPTTPAAPAAPTDPTPPTGA
ncbi:MAG: LemA family protein [Gaiellales bacterium]|nr:LemA family protein [Gaiellales bacterium]